MTKAPEGEEKSKRILIASNKKATRNYDIQARIEAGVVLLGSEAKSCRAGSVHIADAFVRVMGHEVFLIGCHIPEYAKAGYVHVDPKRDRKLLMHHKEIDRLDIATNQKGQSVVPLSIYFVRGMVKVELGIGKGRTHEDMRARQATREANRMIERTLKRAR